MEFLECTYNIYKLITDIIEKLNNESTNILNEYGGFDDL